MGWKAVRDHYRIGHVVTVRGEGVELRAPYGGPVARIDGEGRTTFETSYRGGGLERVAAEVAADPETYLRLLAGEDGFEADVTVYTWRGGEILEKRCETPGWPNVTHDGELMHENTHGTDRAEVVRWAIADAEARVESRTDRVERAELDLAARRGELEEARSDLASLLESCGSTIRHDA